VLAALFAVFPLLLAVQAGRISDRYGVRMPIALGGLAMAAGLVLPIVVGGLPALFLCPALLGLGHILLPRLDPQPGRLARHTSRAHQELLHLRAWRLDRRFHRTLGGGLRHRARRVSRRVRPACGGGDPASFYVLLHRGLMPKHVRDETHTEAKSALDLLAIPALRRTLIMSGVALTGIELFLVLPADLWPRHRPLAPLDHRPDPLQATLWRASWCAS